MCISDCFKRLFSCDCCFRARIKKRISLVLIATYLFLGGVEYVIIIPTAWLYVTERFDGDSLMLGSMFAVYCFAGLISSPIMGWLSDLTGNTKAIFLVGIALQCVGSVMYFIGIYGWLIVLARFVEGCGNGVWAPLAADISRVTDSSERTGVVSFMMSVRESGMILGPSLNYFLQLPHFYVGPFVVDKYTSNGAFMAILWAVIGLSVLFFYHNLPEVQEQLLREQAVDRIVLTDMAESIAEDLPSVNSDAVFKIELHADRGEPEASNDEKAESAVSDSGSTSSSRSKLSVNVWSWHFIYNEYIREETVVVLALSFSTFFTQMVFETIAMPITLHLLYWGVTENSTLYMAAGIEILLGFILVNYLSKCVSDRVLLLIGLFLEIVSLSIAIAFLPTAVPGDQVYNTVIICLVVVLLLLGLPFLLVAYTSLLTKITKLEVQGFTQGVKNVFENVGSIMGPLWAGAAIDRPRVLFGVMLANLGVFTLMTIMSFKYLVERYPTSNHGNRDSAASSVPLTPTSPSTPQATLIDSSKSQ